MVQVNSMREILRVILQYEFDTRYCGLQTSEFTSEIIEAEAKRLSRHRKSLNGEKVYALVKYQKHNRMIECASLDEALAKVGDTLNSVYIINNGIVAVPIVETESELGSSDCNNITLKAI